MKFKKHENAVFLGTGYSINKISKLQWDKINLNYDIWSSSNWIYHPTIVPNFYHIENGEENEVNIFREHLEDKRNLYKNVVFITDDKNIENEILKEFPNVFYYYSIKKFKRLDLEKVDASGYKIDKKGINISRLFDIPLTSILEIMYRFDYKRICFIGVDLWNSKYFWYDWQNKEKICRRTNNDNVASIKHKYYFIKDFIFDFNKRFMIPNKKEIVVGNRDSALCLELDCITLK